MGSIKNSSFRRGILKRFARAKQKRKSRLVPSHAIRNENIPKRRRSALSFLSRSGRAASSRSTHSALVVQTPAVVATPPVIAPEVAVSGRVRECVESFLLDQRSPHTRRAYASDLKRFVQFLLMEPGADQLSAIQRTTVIRFKEGLLAENLSHTTVDRHMATLKSFFRWLVEDGVLVRSPAESVRFLNPKKLSTTQGFTDEEVVRMLAIPDLYRRAGALQYAVLMVLFYCGLRRSELCTLRTTQIRRERGQWVLRLTGKGNRERIVVLPLPVFHAIVHYWRATRRHQPLLQDLPVFLATRRGIRGVQTAALNPSFIYYIVVKTARMAGIQSRVSPHSCRATAISHARDRQVPDRAIQEFAGWASPDMITRYDKRRTAIEQSASLAIHYGDQERAAQEAGADLADLEEFERGLSQGE